MLGAVEDVGGERVKDGGFTVKPGQRFHGGGEEW